MKLVALLVPGRGRKTNWAFLLSPVVSPTSLRRDGSSEQLPRLVRRPARCFLAVLLFYGT